MLILADPWLHNLDPFAIDLTGTFIGDLLNGGLRWYGLSYLAGFFLGYLLIRRVVSAGVSPLKPQQAADLVVTIAIGIVIGGRLGYVLFYKPDLLVEFTPGSFPWWGALKVNEGGMASHGGILGGIAGCVFFAWRHGVRVAHLLDLMAFGGPLGLFMGRVANFINGELYGRPCPSDFALAVQFPQEIAETWQRGSERMDELVALANDSGHFDLDTYQLGELAAQRVQAGDTPWVELLQTHLTPRYPSQLFAGVTEGLVVFTVLLIVYHRPVKAGLVGGWFCVSYALMRVLNELFRLPDAHLMADGKIPPVTRGQWLSLGLLVLGIVTIALAKRSTGDKLGGWMRAEQAQEKPQNTADA